MQHTSFYTILEKYRDFNFDEFCQSIDSTRIEKILSQSRISELDYLALLTPAADFFLEDMAQQAQVATRKHFGNSILLFTPLYISNLCANECVYCSFAAQHTINRKHLSLSEIELEVKAIAATGMRHILLLTGEAPGKVTIDYLEEAIRMCARHVAAVSIEIYPLDVDGYQRCIAAGVDGVTIYQEVYSEARYTKLHGIGPKSEYRYRLDTPERACKSGIHAVTVGPLLGLHNPMSEAFYGALHARWLQENYSSTEVSIAFPRMRPFDGGSFVSEHIVGDRQFVQVLCATRLFLPFAGITVSTRESQEFRNNILPLGVTKMSAGVSTAVGGHSPDAAENASTAQFEIADNRSLDTIKQELLSRGFMPVLCDWSSRYLTPQPPLRPERGSQA